MIIIGRKKRKIVRFKLKKKKKTSLTVPKFRWEYFSVFPLILLSYNGLRFLCTCTLEGSSCRQDNPDRCRLKLISEKKKQKKVDKSFIYVFVSGRKHSVALVVVHGRLLRFVKTISRSICRAMDFDKFRITSTSSWH